MFQIHVASTFVTIQSWSYKLLCISAVVERKQIAIDRTICKKYWMHWAIDPSTFMWCLRINFSSFSLEMCIYRSYFSGCAYIMGKSMYNGTVRVSPVVLLKEAEGRMKMELANMCGLLITSYSFSLASGVPTKCLFH